MIRFFDRYKAPGGLWPVSRQTAGRRFQFRGYFMYEMQLAVRSSVFSWNGLPVF